MNKRYILTCLLLCASSMAQALETITITEKRFESSNTGFVQVIDNIEGKQATHISEITFQSAGTWISQGNGQEHLTAVRSPVLVGGGGCGPFLMMEDNVSLRAPAFCNVNQLFDVSYENARRIEILNGPGTVVHGTNALHGVIHVISPSYTDESQTTIAQEYWDSHDYSRLSLDHRQNNTIIQYSGAYDNGYKDDSSYQQQKSRIKLRHTMGDWQISHMLNAMVLDQETATYVEGRNAYKDDDRKKENPNPDAFREASSFRYQADIDTMFNDQTRLRITPYLRSNNMDFLMHFIPGTPLEENGHDSLGMQLNFQNRLSERLDLLTGLDIDYTKGYLTQTQAKASFSTRFPKGKHYDYEVDVLQTSAFLQTNLELLENLNLGLGTRWEYADYDYDNKLSSGNACVATETNCRYIRPEDQTLSFYNWSPSLSLDWQAMDKLALFYKYSKGYRSPQASELFRLEQGQTLANIDSESITSHEIGLSSDIYQDLDIRLNAFTMKKDNVIIKDANRQNVDNQETRHEGLELMLRWRILETLLFSANMAYAKHQYDSNVQLFNAVNGNIKGNIIDTAPRHIHAFMLSWLPHDFITIDLEHVYMGEYYLDPENSYLYEGHQLTHLYINTELPDAWTIGFSIKNLADADYADRADITVRVFPGDTPVERYFIGEPRSFRLKIGKTF